MRWRNGSNTGAHETCPALIAIDDGDMIFLSPDIHVMKSGQWLNERTGEPLGLDKFYWLPEHELIETIKR